MRSNLFGLMVLLGLLSACGSQTSTSEHKNLVSVTLLTDSQTQVSSAAVYSGIDNVDILVFEGDSSIPVQSLNIKVELYSPPVTIQLESGKTYRFESSFRQNKLEFAWGVTQKTIVSETKILLEGQRIVREVELFKPIYDPSSGRISVGLNVLSIQDPIGTYQLDSFPLSDVSDPTYSVTGGKITEQSKIGVQVEPDNPSSKITLNVELKGLDTNHNQVSFTLAKPLEVIPSDLLIEKLPTIDAKLPDWPQGASTDGFRVEVVGYNNQKIEKVIASSPLEPGGRIHQTLPNAEEIKKYLPFYTDVFENGCNVHGTGRAHTGIRAYLRLVAPNGEKYIIQYGDKPSDSTGGYFSPYGPFYSAWTTEIIYSENPMRYSSSCWYNSGTSNRSIQVDYSIGWNFEHYLSTLGSHYGGTSRWTFDPDTQLSPGEWGWGVSISDTGIKLGDTSKETPKNENFDLQVNVSTEAKFNDSNPAFVSGVIEFSREITPVQTAGMTYYEHYGQKPQECEWKFSDKKVLFSCQVFSATPVLFKIPLSADTRGVAVFARASRGGWLDLEPSNNQFTLIIPNNANATIGVDRFIPSVSGIDVFEAGNFRPMAGVPIDLSGEVGDESGVARVDVYEGVHLWGSATVSPTQYSSSSHFLGEWKLTWTPQHEGNYMFTITAYDPFGNMGRMTYPVYIWPSSQN